MSQRDMERRIEQNTHDVDAIYDILRTMSGTLDEHTSRFEAIDRRLDEHTARFEAIDRRLEGVDGRLEGVDGRLEGVDGRLEGISDQITEVLEILKQR